MKRVRLSDDVVERNIQYAIICKYLGCIPSIVTEEGQYLEVPDELYDKVVELMSSKPKVVATVRFPSKILTADIFMNELGVEPLHIFYSPEGIFIVVFDRDVDRVKLNDLLLSIFKPVIEVK